MDAASLMADLMQKARDQPKLVAAELRGYALGLSDLTADLLEQVKGKKGAQALTESAARQRLERLFLAACASCSTDLPPVGNTGEITESQKPRVNPYENLH